jgi:uncharacterized membrane protein YgdD (TMEM256/DUF423 family)
LPLPAGAFGAHGLKDRLDAYSLEIWGKASDYQIWHALALLACAALAAQGWTRIAKAAAISFVVGIVFFSGSLYVLALTGIKWLGAITPIGGSAFLLGWGILAAAALRSSPR